MTTQQLLDTYYKGLAQKSGWDSVLADDFRFIFQRESTLPWVRPAAIKNVTPLPSSSRILQNPFSEGKREGGSG